MSLWTFLTPPSVSKTQQVCVCSTDKPTREHTSVASTLSCSSSALRHSLKNIWRHSSTGKKKQKRRRRRKKRNRPLLKPICSYVIFSFVLYLPVHFTPSWCPWWSPLVKTVHKMLILILSLSFTVGVYRSRSSVTSRRGPVGSLWSQSAQAEESGESKMPWPFAGHLKLLDKEVIDCQQWLMLVQTKGAKRSEDERQK